MKLPAASAPGALLALLAACQSPPPPNDTAAAPSSSAPAATASTMRTFAYQCEDIALTARFGGEDRVALSWGGEHLTLSRVVSASGARYADEKGNEFWGKGMKEAMFTLAGQKMRLCTGDGEQKPADAPEGSTAYATDQSGTLSTQFHATGSEPGWLADVTLGEAPTLHVLMNYGERQLDVPHAALADDHWSGQSSDGTPVVLAFQRAPCQDSMSGAHAPATVTLTVDGETLHGCGGFRTP